MNLKERLQSDTEAAMRAGDNERRDTLRMLLAAIKQEEVDRRVELDDAAVEALLAKQAKQRRESIVDAERAGRQEMAAEERIELELIQTYLPQMMGADEVQSIAEQVIQEMGAVDMKSMGQVMGQLMPRLKGRADGRVVSDIVRRLLQNR